LACSTHGEIKSTQNFVTKPKEKKPVGRPRHRWEDIRTDLKQMGQVGIDWIYLDQYRDWGRLL
jgi:hypothetical protein